MSKEPSAVEKMIGDFAPKLVDLTDRVLFGEVWERPELPSATVVSQPWRRWSLESSGPVAVSSE